jgi:predicted permease
MYRSLFRRPTFVVLSTVVLTLGIGATLTLFALINAVFFQPLPYADDDRLVRLGERVEGVPGRPVSYPTFIDWRERSEAFERMAAVRNHRMPFTSTGQARVLNVATVTADYFRAIGIAPSLGRDFSPEDDLASAPPVVIISHQFWATEFGGRPESLGSDAVIGDQSYTIVGVAPPELRASTDPDAWLVMGRQATAGTPWLDRSVRRAGFVIAKLKPATGIEQARSDMARVEAQLASEFPVHYAEAEVEIATLRDALTGDLKLPLLLTFAAVCVLLVIVCVNTSILFLLRAIERKVEFGIRAALGASRTLIYLQVLSEGLSVVLLSSVLGYGLAILGTDLLEQVLSDQLFEGTTVRVDPRVTFFALALLIVVCIATSLLPAWRSASMDLRAALSGASRSTSEPRNSRALALFAVFQTSLAVVLLICGSLLANSALRILTSDPGFDKDGVLTFRLMLPARYTGPQRLTQLYGSIVEELRTIPGVDAAAIWNELPGLQPTWGTDIVPEVRGEYQRLTRGDLINVDWRIVSADYFSTMGIRLHEGRAFGDDEAEQGTPVMLIDKTLADRFWPDGSALGSHVRYDGPTEIEIVGVAENVQTYGDASPGRLTIYTPYGRFPFLGDVGVAVRSSSIDPLTIANAIRGRVREMDAGIAILDMATLEQRLVERLAPKTLVTQIVVLFASLAALLAATGIYSVISYVFKRRKRDLAIRIALGSTSWQIAQLVVRKGLTFGIYGIVIGLALAALVSRALSSMLFGVSPLSLSVYASVAITSLVLAGVACLLPAWRASRGSPISSLQAE